MPIDSAEVTFSLLFMLLSLTLGVMTLYGSIQMIRVESYPLSRAAAITAIVPWYCYPPGLPIGICALIVLNDKDVKRAFK